MRIALSLQVRHVQCVPRTHNFLGNQRPGNLTNRLVETSSLISSTLIGYHRGAGVWLFDPGTPGVSRERGRDPPGPGATRHWSSLISLGHEFWEVGCPWTKMVGHPPSKTRSFRIERRGKGGKGDNEKKALIRRSSRGDFRLEIDLAATFENILDQRWDQVWCRLSSWVFENDSRCREENILE